VSGALRLRRAEEASRERGRERERERETGVDCVALGVRRSSPWQTQARRK